MGVFGKLVKTTFRLGYVAICNQTVLNVHVFYRNVLYLVGLFLIETLNIYLG